MTIRMIVIIVTVMISVMVIRIFMIITMTLILMVTVSNAYFDVHEDNFSDSDNDILKLVPVIITTVWYLKFILAV